MIDFLTRSDYDAAANTILRHTQQRPTIGLVLGSGLQFAPAGSHTLKGVPGDWPLFRVVD